MNYRQAETPCPPVVAFQQETWLEGRRARDDPCISVCAFRSHHRGPEVGKPKPSSTGPQSQRGRIGGCVLGMLWRGNTHHMEEKLVGSASSWVKVLAMLRLMCLGVRESGYVCLVPVPGACGGSKLSGLGLQESVKRTRQEHWHHVMENTEC